MQNAFHYSTVLRDQGSLDVFHSPGRRATDGGLAGSGPVTIMNRTSFSKSQSECGNQEAFDQTPSVATSDQSAALAASR
jgi:hypothetical protein